MKVLMFTIAMLIIVSGIIAGCGGGSDPVNPPIKNCDTSNWSLNPVTGDLIVYEVDYWTVRNKGCGGCHTIEDRPMP